jgi:hypothetical protein
VRVSDTLVPATLPIIPRRPPSRRAVAIVAAEMVVVLVATTALALTGSQDFRQVQAVARLRSTARDARAFYAHKGTFDGLHRAHTVSVVGPSKVARAEEVSLRTATPTTFVLATPVSHNTCVFGRTLKHAPMGFVVTHGRACRATAAPRRGWTP